MLVPAKVSCLMHLWIDRLTRLPPCQNGVFFHACLVTMCGCNLISSFMVIYTENDVSRVFLNVRL